MPQNIKDDEPVSSGGVAGSESWLDKKDLVEGGVSPVVSDDEDDQNVQIGARIKSIRLLLGFTQSAFSNFMNVTFQQVQKYEKGLNRISAAALWRLSQRLGVSVSYFFPHQNIGGKKDGMGRASVSEKANFFNFEDAGAERDSHLKEINSLLAQFRRLKSRKVRRRVVSLVQTIAESEQDRPSDKVDGKPTEGGLQ